MTNFDVIKSMSSEEFAYFLSDTISACKTGEFCDICCNYFGIICNEQSCLNWLNSEVSA